MQSCPPFGVNTDSQRWNVDGPTRLEWDIVDGELAFWGMSLNNAGELNN